MNTHMCLIHCIIYCIVVFQAVVMVLESTGDAASHMMIKLLQSFWKTGLITVDQMNRVSSFNVLGFSVTGVKIVFCVHEVSFMS